MKESFTFILLMFVSRILSICIEFILIYKEISLDHSLFSCEYRYYYVGRWRSY
ncbi:hypothetical protein BJX65DRAFT_291697, partial [Aspergillus insuetus]